MTSNVQIKETITIKNAPQLPGITFRKFRGESDFEVMAAVINHAYRADGEEKFTAVERLRNGFAQQEHFYPDKDIIFTEFEGQVVGWGRCSWVAERSGDYIYRFILHLHPDWRRDGIPTAMAEYLLKRLEEISAQHPSDAPKYFHYSGLESTAWHRELMGQLGFVPVRYIIYMVRPCSQPLEVLPLPEGIQVRSIKPEDYRLVFNADQEAFQDQWGYVPPTEASYKRWLNQPTFDPSLWKVAWEGDRIAGMVLNYIDQEENQSLNRKRGYTEDISVHPRWRRQGVARALLSQSIRMFQEMGMDETALGVDTGNPNSAKRLYESVGYKQTKSYVHYRAQLDQIDHCGGQFD